MVDTTNRGLAFLHGFQHGGLRLGRRTVDLVQENQVGVHGTQPGDHLTAFLVPDLGANDVVGHQVGSALNAMEGARYRGREGLRGRRLREAGHGLHQDVATGEKRGGERAAQCFLTHDGVLVDGRHSIKQALRVGQLVIVQVVGHRLSLHARSDALPV